MLRAGVEDNYNFLVAVDLEGRSFLLKTGGCYLTYENPAAFHMARTTSNQSDI